MKGLDGRDSPLTNEEPEVREFRHASSIKTRILHFELTTSRTVPAAQAPRICVVWHNDYAVGQVVDPTALSGDITASSLLPNIEPEQISYAADRATLDGTGPERADATIIVCTRDRPDELARCLAALTRQTCRAAQILVVDNASAGDRTRLVAQAAGVDYVREDRPGLDIARNRGVRAARGTLLLFTDDDVVLHPRWVERTLRAFSDGTADAVTGLLLPATLETEAQWQFERQWGFGRGFRPREFGSDFVERNRRAGVPAWEIGAGANMAFRRTCFERFGMFDERLDVGAAGCSGDSEYWHRILTNGGICRYEPGVIAFHYHRADETGLSTQLKAYMKGHTAALLVQHERAGTKGDLWRLLVTLPRWYARLAIRRLSGDRSAATDHLGEQIAGSIEGVLFYLGAPRPPNELLAPLDFDVQQLGTSILSDDVVTIIVPAYNAEATLDATLRSVCGQTHTRLEIIVVDDGSSDATGEIALAHSAVDPRVRLIRQANGGVACARNIGLDKATGAFTAFVDADDLCTADRTAKMLSAFERLGPDCGLAYSWSVLIDERDMILSEGLRATYEGWVHAALCTTNFIGNGSAAMVRTSVARHVGGFNPGLRAMKAQGCEDIDFYLRIAARHKIALVPEFLTGYRQSPVNMSSDGAQMFRSFRLVEQAHVSRAPAARKALRHGRKNVLGWLLGLALRDARYRAAVTLSLRMALIAPRWAYHIILSHVAGEDGGSKPSTEQDDIGSGSPKRGERFVATTPKTTI